MIRDLLLEELEQPPTKALPKCLVCSGKPVPEAPTQQHQPNPSEQDGESRLPMESPTAPSPTCCPTTPTLIVLSGEVYDPWFIRILFGYVFEYKLFENVRFGELNVKFKNVYVHDTFKFSYPGDQYSVIYLQGGNMSLLIRNCTFERNLNFSSMVNCGTSDGECNVRIENSKFIDTEGYYNDLFTINGFYLSHGSKGTITVVNSIFSGNYDYYGWDIINQSVNFNDSSDQLFFSITNFVILHFLHPYCQQQCQPFHQQF